jgi:hypothetical protein
MVDTFILKMLSVMVCWRRYSCTNPIFCKILIAHTVYVTLLCKLDMFVSSLLVLRPLELVNLAPTEGTLLTPIEATRHGSIVGGFHRWVPYVRHKRERIPYSRPGSRGRPGLCTRSTRDMFVHVFRSCGMDLSVRRILVACVYAWVDRNLRLF